MYLYINHTFHAYTYYDLHNYLLNVHNVYYLCNYYLFYSTVDANF